MIFKEENNLNFKVINNTPKIICFSFEPGYFENPANMYNYLQPVTNGIYRQEGNNQEVSYQVQNGQEATHYTPQASGTTTYNEHERYHPTTYEHYKPHKKPQSQLQVAAASQQVLYSIRILFIYLVDIK